MAKVVASFYSLRLLTAPELQGAVQVIYGVTFQDGLGGFMVWNAADTTADNGSTVIRPWSVPLSSPGRWNLWVGIWSGVGFVEGGSGTIRTPTDSTYTLIQSIPYGETINDIRIALTSGTCTVAIQINGVDVTGLNAIAVSSTPQTVSASALNTMVPTDQLTLVISGSSSPVNLSFTIKSTRT